MYEKHGSKVVQNWLKKINGLTKYAINFFAEHFFYASSLKTFANSSYTRSCRHVETKSKWPNDIT